MRCEFFTDSIPDDLYRRLTYAFGLSAAAIAAIGASAVGAVSSIVSATKGAPKAAAAPVAAPTEDKTAQASAEMRRRQLMSKGYQSNILSDLSSTYGSGGTGGLKALTGA